MQLCNNVLIITPERRSKQRIRNELFTNSWFGMPRESDGWYLSSHTCCSCQTCILPHFRFLHYFPDPTWLTAEGRGSGRCCFRSNCCSFSLPLDKGFCRVCKVSKANTIFREQVYYIMLFKLKCLIS